MTKNGLDFVDLDLFFKVTAVEKLKIYGWGTSVLSENTVTSFLFLLKNMLWVLIRSIWLRHFK